MQTRIPGPWLAEPPLATGQLIAYRAFATPTVILVSLLLTADAMFGALHLVWEGEAPSILDPRVRLADQRS